MSSDRLVEIELSDLKKLREIYMKDWPEYSNGLNIPRGVISNYVHWIEQDPAFRGVKIYTLNGDWTDGTFMLLVGLLLNF